MFEVPRRLWQRPCTAATLAAVMTLLFQVSCMDLGRESLERREVGSGDGYTWLALAEAWERTGQWTPFVAAHNAPKGLETHLTRPFAALVLGLAHALSPWYADEAALGVAGKLSGPLLHAATAAALAGGVRALVGTGGALLAVLCYLAMPVSGLLFSVRDADHHSLHVFLTALTVALLLRGAGGRAPNGRIAALAGGVAGVGIWSGVEMLIPAAVGGLGLGLAWVAWGTGCRARRLCLYAFGMAGALAVALVVERPRTEWASLHLDRISGAHVLLGGLLALGAGGAAWQECGSPAAGRVVRATVAAALSGAVGLTLWATVPHFFLGPYGDLELVVREHLSGLSGEQGIARHFEVIRGFRWYHLCLVGIAGVWVAMGLKKVAVRDARLLLGVGLSVGVAAALHRYRLIHYYEMFAAIALGGAAAGMGRWVGRKAPGVPGAALPAALLVIATPYVAWAVGIGLRESGEPSREAPGWRFWSDRGCDWAGLGRALESPPGSAGGTIATYAAPGPELAAFSGRGVVATGCHCNADGMRDALAMLLSPQALAREVAERRGVELVVLCPSADGWQGHGWFIERSGPGGLYAGLARDEPPDWLVRLRESELGVEGFLVWRTAFGDASEGPLNGDLSR